MVASSVLATCQRVAAREFAALCQGTRVRRLADDTISHEALEADGHCAVQQIVSIMQDAATAATAPVSGASERRYLSQGRGGGRSTLHSVQQQLRRSLGIRRKVQRCEAALAEKIAFVDTLTRTCDRSRLGVFWTGWHALI